MQVIDRTKSSRFIWRRFTLASTFGSGLDNSLNVKYGVTDQETADLYLLNTASIPPSYSSMAVPGRPVIRFLAVCQLSLLLLAL